MRIVVLAALAVLVATPVTAQHLGVRVVGLYSVLDFESGYDPDGIGGLGVGAFAEVALTPTVSIVGDLGYTQSGLRDAIPQTTVENPDPPGVVADVRTRTHLVTLAPALSAGAPTGLVRPYGFAGPRLDVAIAEQTRIDGVSGASDIFPTVAAGIAGGIGIAAGRGRADLRASALWGGTNTVRQSALELRIGVTL